MGRLRLHPNPQAKKKRRKPSIEQRSRRSLPARSMPIASAHSLPGKGARVGQLRHGDVKQIKCADGDMHKGWFLSITEDTDDEGLANAIKNDARERLVPVHPKLIELGFTEYIESLGERKGRIFAALPKDIAGNPAAKWGEWFSTCMRKVCGVTDIACKICGSCAGRRCWRGGGFAQAQGHRRITRTQSTGRGVDRGHVCRHTELCRTDRRGSACVRACRAGGARFHDLPAAGAGWLAAARLMVEAYGPRGVRQRHSPV